MPWYAASVIMYVKFKDGIQNKYPIWENVILIRARSQKAALSLAKKRAKRDEGDSDGSFTWEKRPATWVFAGIRKLVTCSCENRLGHGTEVTFSQMEVKDYRAFVNLVKGRPVKILYEE